MDHPGSLSTRQARDLDSLNKNMFLKKINFENHTFGNGKRRWRERAEME